MKNFKKIMALVIAAMMVMGTMSLAGASSLTPARDQQLKVSGFDDGDGVTFYKILSYNAQTFDFGGWVLESPFDGIVGKEVIVDNSNPNNPVKKTPADKAEAVEMIITQYSADLLGQLSRLATSGAITPTSNTGGVATLDIASDNDIGLYMAIITPQDAKNVYNPVLVSSDMNDVTGVHNNEWIVTSDATYSDNAAAKKSRVGISKEDEQGEESYDLTWKSTRPGETVKYTVESTIPGFGPVFTDPVFDIIDKLNYLELVADPVVASPTNAVYTVKNNTTGFEISFDKDYLRTVTTPTTVTITYEARVTTDAPQTVNLETNEVWVKYTPDHKDKTKFNYEKDDTEHTTYSIDASTIFNKGLIENVSGSEVVKVGLKSDKVTPITSTKVYSQVTKKEYWEGPLAGAVFELLRDDQTTVYEGSQYAPAAIQGFDYGNIVSQADGRFNIPGLDAGTYYLREKSAPTGYLKDNHVAKIVIEATYKPVDRTMWTNGTDWEYSQVDASYQWSSTYSVDVLDHVDITVDGDKTTHQFYNDGGKEIKWSSDGSIEKPHNFKNIEGVELPSTGGMGTTLFYAIGAILVLGAGILLVSKRRMSAY